VTTVRGGRVVLRPFRPDEVDRVLARDARDAPERADAERLEARRTRLALSGTRTTWEILFAIEGEGRLVGELQARYSDGAMPPGVYELGIELYDDGDRGRGLGTEALGLAVAHLFAREDALRVQASTGLDNAAMRRSLEKSGFTFEGILRGFMPAADGPRDYALYAMTRKDWEETG
jgi:RimJ/RimL family protein N-acetyltransferase